MTICSCGIKAKVSCNVNDIDNAINDCKETSSIWLYLKKF